MISDNRLHVNRFFRPQSSTRLSESSSGIDIIDEDSMTETHSSDSEPLVIRYDKPTNSRQVIIKSNYQTVTIPNKPQPRYERQIQIKQRRNYSYEKQSSLHFSKSKHYPSSSDHKEEKLKRLYSKYSNEDIRREWKPLTALETRELYQYAFDKYHEKSFLN